jgi:diguanylate cyclase (GGDEF)-like protein
MYEIQQLLESYVRGIRALTGAERAALFVPGTLSGLSQPILVDDGGGPPIAELANVEHAVSFAAGIDTDALLPDAEHGALVVAGRETGVGLIPLPPIRGFWSRGLRPRDFDKRPTPVPARRSTDKLGDESATAWLGLRLHEGEGTFFERLKGRDLVQQLFGSDGSLRWWEWLFSLGGAIAGHAAHVSAILTDPVTGLPQRAGFHAILAESLERSRREAEGFALLLVNPDDFAQINETLGRTCGDRVVGEISERLRSVTRSSDPVARYGGVVFAVILPATDRAQSAAVAEKIITRLSAAAYLDGAVRLSFSVGFCVFEAENGRDLLPGEIIRRADQALNAAKRRGGNRATMWQENLEQTESGAYDRLSGIFTGDVSKDYRNMVLLWDTAEVIARSPDFGSLSREIVDRLQERLRINRLGLFLRKEGGRLELQHGVSHVGDGAESSQLVQSLHLEPAERALVDRALSKGSSESDEMDGDEVGHVFPLQLGDENLGVLYFAGNRDRLSLDRSDAIFLRALAGQVAVALDRARLAELEAERQQRERERLETQLHELREAMRRAKMVYRSPQMESVLERAARVAPTDATILITGESGTGKELLARTVHELSPRRQKPLIVVDCVAIATTLMEAELFGHEKGAYTGAHGRRTGRLAEADGGTVLLDEIGELPLEVQSKLLRFVQDKQFTPVGGTRPKNVDVRILAATNRDLTAEVAAGTFREDLYYRLNVINIEVPPLRVRPDDILHLAQYFLETFSVQYQKPLRGFTEAARDAMQRYAWPGNIRELQNRIMQAVILCEAEEIDSAELQLGRGGAMTAPASAKVSEDGIELRSEAAPEGAHATPPEEQLRLLLRAEIEVAISEATPVVFPLGRWIQEDFLLEANDLTGDVARRAAARLGLPETTFRRRLDKARDEVRAGTSVRSGRWHEVRTVIRKMIDHAPATGTEPIASALRILLEEIVGRLPTDTRRGAQLLAVTPPTFRKRLAKLRDKNETPEE